MPLLLGHFRVIIEFMAANFWAPLARLTLSAYLVHMLVIYSLFLSNKGSYYYSGANLVYDSIYIFVLSYLVAIPVSLVSESPTMALERLFLYAPKKQEPIMPKAINMNEDEEETTEIN